MREELNLYVLRIRAIALTITDAALLTVESIAQAYLDAYNDKKEGTK